MNKDETGTLWYQSNLDVFLNRWFARYEEARDSREREGGYLLPYRRQFFVCEPGAIRALGLDPDDADWRRIGWDCARPADAQAYERLKAKREQAAATAAPRSSQTSSDAPASSDASRDTRTSVGG